jgi:hypothetical protein
MDTYKILKEVLIDYLHNEKEVLTSIKWERIVRDEKSKVNKYIQPEIPIEYNIALIFDSGAMVLSNDQPNCFGWSEIKYIPERNYMMVQSKVFDHFVRIANPWVRIVWSGDTSVVFVLDSDGKIISDDRPFPTYIPHGMGPSTIDERPIWNIMVQGHKKPRKFFSFYVALGHLLEIVHKNLSFYIWADRTHNSAADLFPSELEIGSLLDQHLLEGDIFIGTARIKFVNFLNLVAHEPPDEEEKFFIRPSEQSSTTFLSSLDDTKNFRHLLRLKSHVSPVSIFRKKRKEIAKKYSLNLNIF